MNNRATPLERPTALEGRSGPDRRRGGCAATAGGHACSRMAIATTRPAMRYSWQPLRNVAEIQKRRRYGKLISESQYGLRQSNSADCGSASWTNPAGGRRGAAKEGSRGCGAGCGVRTRPSAGRKICRMPCAVLRGAHHDCSSAPTPATTRSFRPRATSCSTWKPMFVSFLRTVVHT